MKKRLKIYSQQEAKFQNWIGVAAVVIVLVGVLILKPLFPTGLAIHSLGSEVVPLELSGSVPATSQIIYLAGGQEVRQPVTSLGFQPYDTIDENNQTISYVDLSNVILNVSQLGFNFNQGEYNLTVTVENSDVNIIVPLTVEADFAPTNENIAIMPVVEETPQTDTVDYISSIEEISQGSIVVGKNARWRRVINLTNQSSDVNISLPPEAENISVKKVEGDVEVPVESLEISDTSRLAI